MEHSESTAGEGTAGSNQKDQTVLLASKPLHRFIKREPKALGVVILIFGCAELLIGIQLNSELDLGFSRYIPFWQGLLFLVCGFLSIYTEVHPSKKLVTVCLSMYIVTVLGIIVSFIYRLISIIFHQFIWVFRRFRRQTVEQILWIQSALLISSFCVLVVLIFLCVVARLALKSTRTQIIVHQVQPSQTTITSY